MTKSRCLTDDQLEKLKEHKYKSEGCSILDPCFQPYWNWLVEQIPTTWAPNSLTLAGLTLNVLSTAILMVYSPKGYGPVPWWCYLFCAISLFIYQSLDAIDGKQARRTNSSSPLGELFDHGCDALSTVTVIIGSCIATQMGDNPRVFSIVTFMTLTLFYTVQWRTYVKKTMMFGFLDVTEAQLAVIGLYLITALFGSSIWHIQLFMEIEVNILLWLLILLVLIYLCFSCLLVISNHSNVSSIKQYTNSNQKRSHLFPPKYLPSIPLLIFLILGFSCSFFSNSQLMENNVVLYHFTFGVISTKLCCQVLTSYMTKVDMPRVDSIFIGPLLLLAAQILDFSGELLVLWIVLSFSSINLLSYVYAVCRDICDFLHIHCFRITS